MSFRKKLTTKFIAILAIVLCTVNFYACATPDNVDPDKQTSIYTSGNVEVASGNLVAVNEPLQLVVSASARSSLGKYVTSSTGFTYTSSDLLIASVDSNGIVKGKSEGVVDITIKHSEYAAEKTITIKVIDKTTLNLSTGEGLNIFGRAQTSDNGLLLANMASGFQIAFKGQKIKAEVRSESAKSPYKNYLQIIVDNSTSVIEIAQNEINTEITLASGLSEGLHTLSVYKMTDEELSKIQILSLSSDVDYYTAPDRQNLKISVYGDAFTCAQDLSITGDGTSIYAFLTAAELNAELDIMCNPLLSVAVGKEKDICHAKDVWNRCFIKSEDDYEISEKPADFIIINLGENDARAINEGAGTIKDFADGYKAMLIAMRESNTNAKIICCFGITAFGGSVGDSIKRTVRELNEAGDGNVFALDMVRCDGKRLGESGLPNALGHKENATLLIETISGLLASKPVEPKNNYDIKKNDIHVILLGGQSNMEGNSHWRYLESLADFNEYKTGFDGIKMSYVNHVSKAQNSPDFQKVKLGFGGAYNNGDKYNTGSGLIDDTFGPEIGLARTLQNNNYGNKVVLIKFAQGGTSFYQSDPSWRAPSGTLYKGFVTYVKACLKELSKTYNVSLDAMCWMQGESDTETQAAVDSYGSNLANFIKALRKDFAEYNSEFMFYDAFIKWPYEWQYNRPTLLNEAKSKLAEASFHQKVIDTISAGVVCNREPYGNIDLAHFDAASSILLGELFAQEYIKDFPVI